LHYVLVRHKVEEYSKWKRIYDENMENRKNYGSKGSHVFRSIENPDEVVILYDWDDLENARKFFKSEDFKKKVKLAGIPDELDIYFLEGIGRTSA
jgi:heme-degrading monooxygenase HmoA